MAETETRDWEKPLTCPRAERLHGPLRYCPDCPEGDQCELPAPGPETWIEAFSRLGRAKDYAGALALLRMPLAASPAPPSLGEREAIASTFWSALWNALGFQQVTPAMFTQYNGGPSGEAYLKAAGEVIALSTPKDAALEAAERALATPPEPEARSRWPSVSVASSVARSDFCAGAWWAQSIAREALAQIQREKGE